MSLVSPFPLRPSDEPFRARLHQELLAILYLQANGALVSLCLVWIVLWFVLGPVPGQQPLIAWIYGALFGVIVVRFIMQTYLIRHPEALPNAEQRHLLFMSGTLLVGVGYAALILASYPFLGVAQFGILAVCLAGINAGALITMAASPACYVTYAVPSIGTLIWLTATEPKDDYGLLALIFAVYLAFMMILAVQVHLTLRNGILLSQRLTEAAQRDSLTGLRNRLYLSEFMDQKWPQILRLWQSPQRDGANDSQGIIMIDIDYFKQINDNHGHAAGDLILRQFADVLMRTVRVSDIVTRWGGEEFVIVAQDSSRMPPPLLAERIQRAVEAHRFVIPGQEPMAVRCSMGFTYLPFLPDQPEYLSWEECLRLADGALYLAKHQGRNRIIGVQAGVSRSPEAMASLREPGKDLLHALEASAIQII